MKILNTTSEIESSVEHIEITFQDNNGKEFTAEFTRQNHIKLLPKIFDDQETVTINNQVELSEGGYDLSDEEEDQLWNTARDYSAPEDNDNDSKTHAVIMGIDWKMLRKGRMSINTFMVAGMDGALFSNICYILTLIDDLKDAVVGDGLFKVEEVFRPGVYPRGWDYAAEGSDSIEPGCDSTVQVQSAMPIEEMKKAFDSIGESYNRWVDALDEVTPRDKVLEGNPDDFKVSFEPTDKIEGWDKVDTAPGKEVPEFIGLIAYRDKNYPIRQITYYAKEEPAEILHSLISTNELNDLINHDGTSPDKDIASAAVDLDNRIAFFMPEGEISGTTPQFVCKCLNSQLTDFVYTHVDGIKCDGSTFGKLNILGHIDTAPGEEEPEPAKLIPGRKYKVLKLDKDDCFNDPYCEGKLNNLTYIRTYKLIRLKNKDGTEYGFLPGATFELLPE